MLSPSPLKPSAPSASLLRFLRSQSDSVHFFTANPTTRASSPRESALSHQSRKPRTSSLARTSKYWTHLDPAPCQATLEAGLFSIPKSIRPESSSTPRSSRLSLCHRNSNANPLLPPFKSSRNASTKSRPLLRRLLDLKRGRAAGKDEHKPNGNNGPFLDDGTGNLFNIGRSLAGKASNELRLRCTEFDNNGNVTLVNGEFKKSELIAKVSADRFNYNWIERSIAET